MEIAGVFGRALLISLSGALMPGPLFTLSVRETLRRGFWVGPIVAAGHALIELVLVIGLALGLTEFLDEGAGTAVIALVGGLFLLWMGFQMVRTAPKQELEFPEAAGDESPATTRGRYRRRLQAVLVIEDPGRMLRVLVPAGILVSIANPYWSIWWASIGMAQMTDALDHGVAGIGAFFSGHILADFAWLTIVGFALATGRHLMSRRAYQGILVVCGVFLLLLSILFLYEGIDFVL